MTEQGGTTCRTAVTPAAGTRPGNGTGPRGAARPGIGRVFGGPPVPQIGYSSRGGHPSLGRRDVTAARVRTAGAGAVRRPAPAAPRGAGADRTAGVAPAGVAHRGPAGRLRRPDAALRDLPGPRGFEAIWEALSIGSERIGHAVSAVQDDKLLQELKVRSTGLELNPTSNVRTGVCPSFAAHPLRTYFDRGLLVTLNSDDPAFFGSDLANEFLLAHTEQGFTRDELRQLARNSIRASFLPEAEKARWIAQIDTIQ